MVSNKIKHSTAKTAGQFALRFYIIVLFCITYKNAIFTLRLYIADSLPKRHFYPLVAAYTGIKSSLAEYKFLM